VSLSCIDLIKPNHSKNGSFGDEQLTAVPKFLEAKGENLMDSREIHKIYWHACPALISYYQPPGPAMNLETAFH